MLRHFIKFLLAPIVAITLLCGCQPIIPYSITQSASGDGQTDQQFVNNQTYSWMDATPADTAFTIVAADRGWTPDKVQAWLPFVDNIMKYESGYCPNMRRGARFANSGVNCIIARQGRGSDSGFGQVISIHYSYPNGWLCKQEGLCSAQNIISTPWNSMTALVALVERSGGSPWCYSKAARRLHNCNLVPVK